MMLNKKLFLIIFSIFLSNFELNPMSLVEDGAPIKVDDQQIQDFFQKNFPGLKVPMTQIIAVTPDGKFMANSIRGSDTYQIYLFMDRGGDWEDIGTYSGPESQILKGDIVPIAWKPDGKVLVSAAPFKAIRFWRLTGDNKLVTGKEPGVDFIDISKDNIGSLRSIAWHPTKDVIAVGDYVFFDIYEKNKDKWEKGKFSIDFRQFSSTQGGNFRINKVIWSKDGKTLYIIAATNTAQFILPFKVVE